MQNAVLLPLCSLSAALTLLAVSTSIASQRCFSLDRCPTPLLYDAAAVRLLPSSTLLTWARHPQTPTKQQAVVCFLRNYYQNVITSLWIVPAVGHWTDLSQQSRIQKPATRHSSQDVTNDRALKKNDWSSLTVRSFFVRDHTLGTVSMRIRIQPRTVIINLNLRYTTLINHFLPIFPLSAHATKIHIHQTTTCVSWSVNNNIVYL